MVEKTMNARKNFILLRLICFVVAVALCTPLVLCQASAAENSIEIIQYDDYAEYSVAETEGMWNVTATFPNTWPGTIVESVWGEERYKGNQFTYDLPYNFPSGVTPPGMRFTITPLGIEPILYLAPDFQYTDLRLLDSSLIPKSASLYFEFDITISSLNGGSSDVLDSLGNVLFYVAFFRPSSSGGWFELAYSDNWEASVSAELNGYYTIHIITSFKLSDYPDYENLAFAPFIQIVDFTGFRPNVIIDGQDYARIGFQYDSFSMEFPLSDAAKISDQLDKMPEQIGEQIKEVIEQEKTEAKKEGNKFVNQILDALPDPSAGVLEAMKQLTDSTAYTGTDAVLSIPAIVLPGIEGLFEEAVIWGGTEFDFSEYLSFLPENIMTLVQSLFTIAIVLYCVYEIKGIISYCLTLRESKGG